MLFHQMKIEIIELDESDGSTEKQRRDVPIPECSQSGSSCSSQFGNLTDLRRHIGTANEPFKMLVQVEFWVNSTLKTRKIVKDSNKFS